jgi:uncharacterized membrane protein YcaP (DUF421 family)
VLEGMPTVLVQDGQFLEPHLRKKGLDRAQIEMAMRQHGVDGVKEMKLAVLETDGSISIVPVGTNLVRACKHVRRIRH